MIVVEKKVFVGMLYDDDARTWKKGYFPTANAVPNGFISTSVIVYLIDGVLRQKKSQKSMEVVLGHVYNIPTNR